MAEAVRLSVSNVEAGGGPFAAVVSRRGVILGSGVNRVVASNDPTAHAEIAAIREACKILGTFQHPIVCHGDYSHATIRWNNAGWTGMFLWSA